MPKYLVTGKIHQDGKIYRPGDRIVMTYEEATKHYLNNCFCIRITDKKHLNEIDEIREYHRRETRRKTLLGKIREHGIKRIEGLDNELFKH